MVFIDDAVLIPAMGAGMVAIAGFYAWQQRFMMQMIPDMKAAIERNTSVGERILMILEAKK